MPDPEIRYIYCGCRKRSLMLVVLRKTVASNLYAGRCMTCKKIHTYEKDEVEIKALHLPSASVENQGAETKVSDMRKTSGENKA
jgi:hypothetical protein